jgi:hypothetical protein
MATKVNVHDTMSRQEKVMKLALIEYGLVPL